MRIFLTRRARIALWPSAVVLPLLAALWCWGRWGYVRPDAWHSVAGDVFVGWMGMMFLAVTLAGIVWAGWPGRGEGKGAGEQDRRLVFLGFAMLIDGSGLLLLVIGMGSGMIRFPDVVRVYLLLAAWSTMWVQWMWVFRRLAPRWKGAAAVLGVSVAMVVFAAPVTGVPLVRASAHWGARAQGTVVNGIGYAAPLIGVMDGIKDSLRVDWAQRPEMYQLSVLGQDVALPTGRWWVNFLVYAGLAAVGWGVGVWKRESRNAKRET